MALTKKQKDVIIRLIASSSSYSKVTATTVYEANRQHNDIIELCRLYSGKITLKEYFNAPTDPFIRRIRIDQFNIE